AKADRSLSLRPAWSTEQVPGQPGQHRETLSQETKTNKQNKTKTNEQKQKTREQSSSKLPLCLGPFNSYLTSAPGLTFL
ncbi:hypothetical protein ACP0FP_25645, partial [Escherichia coli]|uniref:hypothetical protein n=1 Tax=Escherichia coli TaxID=562 RepID=UPI003CED9D0C